MQCGKSFFRIAIVSALVLFSTTAWMDRTALGAVYNAVSENKQIRVVDLPAQRGSIYDRKGNLLVTNVPSFNLYLDPEFPYRIRQTRYLRTRIS